MMDRSMICGELCRHAQVKRVNPTRTGLTKREMVAIWRHFVYLTTRIDQLEAAIAVYKSGKVAPHVQAPNI